MTLPRGCNVPAAREIKKKVKIPLAVSGRISPEMGEDLIKTGQADIISIARGLVADPDLPAKAKAGKLKEIRRCIACNACIDRLFWEKDIVCTVNPAVGREKEFEIRQAPAAKKVMVIGGGPAGLEAARVARLRGHDVDLYEESPKLGGRMDAASRASFKKELKGIADYYESTLDSLGVKLHLKTKMTPDLAAASRPDVVVIAAGSTPLVPEIPGIRSPRVVQAVDVLLDRVRVEGQAAIIGGGMVGCEAAVYLAEKGAKVTILEMLPYVAYGIPRLLGKMVKEDMKKMGVRILTGCKVLEIQDGEVIYEKDGKKAGLKTQWAVLALGSRALDQQVESFKKLFKEVYVIGDCAEPRKALDAIHEAARIGGAL
jgi:NADPH-dependent 2,4-dienoyl-CoA reductase/sulfur reductase-like enzyme